MDYLKKSPFEFSVEELDRELIARAAQNPDAKPFTFGGSIGPPTRDEIVKQARELYNPAKAPTPNKELDHISTDELVKVLMYKIGRIEIGGVRGIWHNDD